MPLHCLSRCDSLRLLAAVAITAVAGCSDATGPRSGQEQIVFVSTREGLAEYGTPIGNLYRMNPDGSGVQNLTQAPGRYDNLAVTPDGRTIVFEATRSDATWAAAGCYTQVGRIGVDGSGMRTVTSGGCSGNPRVSPDGRLIAYIRGGEVWVTQLDGTGARVVSAALPPVQPNSCGEVPKTTVRTLGWASAGRVLFERHICFEGTTYFTVDTQGNGLVEVGYHGATAYFSPDGTRLAYVRAQGTASPALVLANADGTNGRTIAEPADLPTRHSLFASVWSPDGTQLFHHSSTGQYVITADGTDSRRIADAWPTFRGGFNSWSRDGTRLAFTATGDARSDILVMRVDGSGLLNLTAASTGYNSGAVWVRR